MAARRKAPRTAEGAWYSNYNGYHENNTGTVLPRNDDDYYFVRDKLPYGAGFNPKNMMTDHYGRAGGMPALYDPAHDQQRPNGDRQPLFEPQQRQDNERLQLEQERQRYNADYYTGGHNQADWEPPEQFSPRRSSKDPNFQRAHGEGRRTPPWERDRDRDRDGQVPRGYEEVTMGHYYDQGQKFTQERQFTPRMTHAEVPRPSGEESRKSGGAFLFVRFPLQRGENTTCVAKACIQAKTSDLGGRFVGIARKVFDFGFPPGVDDGCAVFQFPSLMNAEVFYQSDKRIRQPDFPPPQGHAEIFAISLTQDPNTMQLYDTFLLSEVSLNAGMSDASLADYRDKFMEPFAALVTDRDALPYAAFSKGQDDRKSLRRHFFPNRVLVTLHMFRNPKHLESVMEEKRYSQLRAIHNTVATERCSIFSIDRQACP